MRVAYLGPRPTAGGGVPYMANVVLAGLLKADVDVTAFLPASLGETHVVDGLPTVDVDTRWRYDRWYSNSDFTKFASGGIARAIQMLSTGRALSEEHARRPFDVIYQFSVPELYALRGRFGSLPPVVVHPETHAVAEYGWHRRERDLVSEELRRRSALVGQILRVRGAIQNSDLQRAARIIAPSGAFARHLVDDAGVAASKIRVIPNPIDTDRFRPRPIAAAADGRIHIACVSRLAVRKGIEMLVALSHRLTDLPGQVVIDLYGDRSLFSDYRHLIDGANADMLCWHGSVAADDLAERLAQATLLVQPSHYEPFALTVAEALATGLPVVTSDEVGATEMVDPRCAIRFPAGDIDAFERAVRTALDSVADADDAEATRRLAVAEARRLFAPGAVVPQIVDALEGAVT